MGELQKRIAFLYEKPKDKITFKDLSIITKSIDEMCQEFPIYPNPPSEKDYPNMVKLQAKWYELLDEYDSEVGKWFLKWLANSERK